MGLGVNLLVICELELRLFGKPVFMAFLSPLIYWFFAYWLPQRFEANLILKHLGSISHDYAGLLSIAVFAYAMLLWLYRVYKYQQYIDGKTPSCPRCGMMTQARYGRYGSFWGCMRYPSCRGTEDY